MRLKIFLVGTVLLLLSLIIFGCVSLPATDRALLDDCVILFPTFGLTILTVDGVSVEDFVGKYPPQFHSEFVPLMPGIHVVGIIYGGDKGVYTGTMPVSSKPVFREFEAKPRGLYYVFFSKHTADSYEKNTIFGKRSVSAGKGTWDAEIADISDLRVQLGPIYKIRRGDLSKFDMKYLSGRPLKVVSRSRE